MAALQKWKKLDDENFEPVLIPISVQNVHRKIDRIKFWSENRE